MNDKQEAKFQELTGRPVGHLVCKMAVPTIISMMVTACYNMVDTYFVGQLHSNSATGAVGVVFSLMAVIQAVGFFFGHGSGNYISRPLGRHETADAEKMAATGVTLAFLAGCVILVLGQIFLTPLARLLGSTDTILSYARSYLRIILLGAPYMTASFVLNNQLRFQGSAAYGMVGIAAGAVLNVGLDPLLIFRLNMGVAGAALATILSQLASFCMLLLGCARGGNLRIRLKNLCFRRDLFVEIGKGGLPSLCRQGLASIATICLNRSAGLYGDAAIAAMSVVSRAMMLAQSALIGFGQGFQPVCGFNYGAGLYHRVKEGFRFCVKWSTVFLTAVSVLGLARAPKAMTSGSLRNTAMIWGARTRPRTGGHRLRSPGPAVAVPGLPAVRRHRHLQHADPDHQQGLAGLGAGGSPAGAVLHPGGAGPAPYLGGAGGAAGPAGVGRVRLRPDGAPGAGGPAGHGPPAAPGKNPIKKTGSGPHSLAVCLFSYFTGRQRR